jgi:hypothetical protein
MKTFHEWLATREGPWLNDKNAVIGLSKLNPLPKDSAVNKSLCNEPKPSTPTVKPVVRAKLGLFKAKAVGKLRVPPATAKAL